MPDANPFKVYHRVSRCFGNRADLPLSALSHDNSDPRAVLISTKRNHSAGNAQRAHDVCALAKPLQTLMGQDPVKQGSVLPLDLIARMKHRVSPVPIVGQEKQTGRILVEPAYRKQSFLSAHELSNQRLAPGC
jgi:hypothetical protein